MTTEKIITSYGLSQYRTDEAHYAIWARDTPRNGTRRGIVFCHGVSQTATGWRSVPVNDKVRALAAAGYIILSADLSATTYNGENWGNDDHIDAIADAVTYLRSTFDASASPVGLLGSSMGACGALAYARTGLADVFAVAGMIPVLSVEDVYTDGQWGQSTWPEIALAYALDSTTVAAGSNGVDTSTFAGAGTLNVASTTGFPASGTLRLCRTSATPDTPVTISYTGTGATTFTGCTSLTGTNGTMTTGDVVVTRDLPDMSTHQPVDFGASDLLNLPVRLWTASDDSIAATTADAQAWETAGAAGADLTITNLGAVGHQAEYVDAQQVVQFFDDNGGRT